jgi:hypothetical protein
MMIEVLVNIPAAIAGCVSCHLLGRGADSTERGSRGLRSYEEELLVIEVIPPHDRLSSRSH